MAVAVFLKGINVGGHRRFRPAALAEELHGLDVVNVGAAGTFVVLSPVRYADLRREFARRLPFEAEIMMCRGSEILKLLSHDFFEPYAPRPDIVRFVSVLSRLSRTGPSVPCRLPSSGAWFVKVLARRGRFVVGLHRRQMRAIGELGRLEQALQVAMTTRSWSTMIRVGRVLEEGRRGPSTPSS